jgi:serine phosphatase RsbU (regulator of sigma subunit)
MNDSLRIAVADDEPDMQAYFRKCLSRMGHQVVAVAENGRELVERSLATRPDLVITDIKMPDMDGIDAVIRLSREWPVPVILVSAYHDPQLIARAGAVDILEYLVKPIKQADLEPVIALAMHRFQQFQALRKDASDLRQRDRLMQIHLDAAGRMQRQMLPSRLPELPSFTFALAYHPLGEVSGDYYDFARLPSGRLGILIADASGHGIPAAFVSVMASTAFHAYAQGIESPAEVLQTMNQRLANLMEADRFLTMFYGVLDCQTRRLVYGLAGHPPPLYYRRATSRVEVLDDSQGPVIGIGLEARFIERSVQLGPGDVVLIYTDGVTECRNEQQQLFGQQRLEAFLAARGSAGAGVVSQLDTELMRFRGSQPFQDDVTCIGLGVQESKQPSA